MDTKNVFCAKCTKQCKQSSLVKVVGCPLFQAKKKEELVTFKTEYKND